MHDNPVKPESWPILAF